MFLAIQLKAETRECLWLNFNSSIPPTWKIYDAYSNLNIPPGISNFFLPNDGGLGALMYIANQALTGRPNPKTALFIYDQIDIHFSGKWTYSQADFFGLPLQISSGEDAIGFVDKVSREFILTKLREIEAPFDTYQMPTTGNNIYRWFAPAQKFCENIWEKAIAYGLSQLNRKVIGYNGTNYLFSASDENSILVNNFIRGVKLEQVKISNINTYTALNGILIPQYLDKKDFPLDCSEAIEVKPENRSGDLIAAAINRGVLHDINLWKTPVEADVLEGECWPRKIYYQCTAENFGFFNHYANVMHQHSIDHRCMAFNRDDVFEQNAYLTVDGNATEETIVTITLLPFQDKGVGCFD